MSENIRTLNHLSDGSILPYQAVSAKDVKRGDMLQRNCAPDALVQDVNIGKYQVIFTIMDVGETREVETSHSPEKIVFVMRRKGR